MDAAEIVQAAATQMFKLWEQARTSTQKLTELMKIGPAKDDDAVDRDEPGGD